MKEKPIDNKILDLLIEVSSMTPLRVENGTKTWRHRGHTIVVGPIVFSPEDFVPKRSVVIDGKKITANWEQVIDRDNLRKK